MKSTLANYYPFKRKVLDGENHHAYILSFLSPQEIAKTRTVNKSFASVRCTAQLIHEISNTYGELVTILVRFKDTVFVYRHGILSIDHTQDHSVRKAVDCCFPKALGPIKAAVGNNRSDLLILTDSNELYVRGKDGYGLLGVGDFNGRQFWTRVSLPNNVKIQKLLCTEFTSGFLTDNGEVYLAGNIFGQVNREYSFIRVMKDVSDPIIDVDISEHLVCLTGTGEMYGSGRNNWGQLGIPLAHNGNRFECIRIQPEQFKPSDIQSLACTDGQTLILTSDKKLHIVGHIGGLASSNHFMELIGYDFEIQQFFPKIWGGFYLLSTTQDLYDFELEDQNMRWIGRINNPIKYIAASRHRSIIYVMDDQNNIFVRYPNDVSFQPILSLPPMQKNYFKSYLYKPPELEDREVNKNRFSFKSPELSERALDKEKIRALELALDEERIAKVNSMPEGIQARIIHVGRLQTLMYGSPLFGGVFSLSLGYLLSKELNLTVGISVGVSLFFCFVLLTVLFYVKYKEAMEQLENILSLKEMDDENENVSPKSPSIGLP